MTEEQDFGDNVLHGDQVHGDKVTGDKIGRDKIIIYGPEVSGLRPLEQQPITAPKLPPSFLERPKELDELRHLVMRKDTDQNVGLTAVYGMGGTGKSVLVSALCHDPDVQRAFPDGLIWVRVGRDPGNLVDQMQAIGVTLGDHPPYYTSPEASVSRLSEILAARTVLIVLDDVWEAKHVRRFQQFDAPRCHIVFTTRSSTVAGSVGAASLKLNVLEPSDAIKLLEKISESDVLELAYIAECLSYLPLALELAGKRLKEGMSADSWLSRYREHVSELKLDLTSTDPHESLEACFDLSVEQLPEEQQLLYHSLGIFPEDWWIPQRVILRLWHQLAPERNEREFSDLIGSLARLALVEVSDESVALHDLLHDYNRHKLGERLPDYHTALLSVYNPEKKPWYEIKHDGYLYHHLPYHIINAGREEELFELLKSATSWMEATFDEPDLAIESLIVDIWHLYWEKHRGEAEAFLIREWLPRPVHRRKQEGYTARVMAVRCAFEVDYDDGLALSLCHSDKRLRSAAMAYTYYLSQQKSEQKLARALNILKAVGAQATGSGLLPNRTALTSIFLLAPLMAIDQYQEDEIDSPVIKDVAALLLDSINSITTKSLLRFFGPTARTLVVRLAVKMFTYLLSTAESSSVNNIGGLGLFFLQPDKVRKQAREALPYLDRTHGSLADISDLLLGLYQADDRISVLIAEFILIGNGIHNPAEAEAILQRLVANSDDPGCVYILSAAHIWYTIMDRQPDTAITASALKTMETFVTKWLDSGQHGYGGVRHNDRTIPYYPLAYYAALWTKAHRGIQADLLNTYANRAAAEDDEALKLHIIGSFSDFRQTLYDYPTALGILTPYVDGLASKVTDKDNHAGDDPIRKQLVKSLGSLRGLRPAPVDAFLQAVDAPLDLIKDIRSYSYQKPSDELYVRFYRVISDVVAYAPIGFVREIIEILHKALEARSMDEMAAVLVSELVAQYGSS